MTFPTNTTYSPAMRPVMRPVVPNPHFQSHPKAEERKRQKMKKERLAHQNEDASIWRDTGLRYGGYADEVGEFMGPYLGGFGKFLGYGLSGLYVMADMATSLPKKYKNANPEMSRGEKIRKTGAEALDLGIFHLVATLLIPPMIIGKAAQLVENKLTGDGTRFGKFVKKEDGQIRKFAKKAADEKGWINQKLHPKLHRAGHLIADALEPLSRVTARFDADKLKKIPFYGEFLSELPKEVEALRSIKNFSDDKLISLGLQKSLPMAVGISLVPLIAHPFDELMLKVQDWTIRPLLGKNKIIRDENGKRQSVKDPAFWGHQKQPVKQMELPADPVTPASLPEAIKHHRNQSLRAKARFGYYQPMPGLTPNPMYPKPPVSPVAANPFNQPVYQPAFPFASPVYPPVWSAPASPWTRS